MSDKRRENVSRAIQAHIEKLVQSATKLTAEQRLRLHGLLYGPDEPPEKPRATPRHSKAWRERQERHRQRDEADDLDNE